MFHSQEEVQRKGTDQITRTSKNHRMNTFPDCPGFLISETIIFSTIEAFNVTAEERESRKCTSVDNLNETENDVNNSYDENPLLLAFIDSVNSSALNIGNLDQCNVSLIASTSVMTEGTAECGGSDEGSCFSEKYLTQYIMKL